MKRILIIVPVATLLTFCSSSKSATKSSSKIKAKASAYSTLNSQAENSFSTDTVVITGTQYIPVEGRSEAGTPTDIAGDWTLNSLNGLPVQQSKINADLINPNLQAKEKRQDSITRTQTIGGATHTTTTVSIEKNGASANKITPAQGSNYHIPARPNISFYGANETFTGFTGCNRFSGRYTITGENNINFQNATASTKMVCIGDYNEDDFLNALRKVNSFRATNGKLELLEGKTVLLVFSKRQH